MPVEEGNLTTPQRFRLRDLLRYNLKTVRACYVANADTPGYKTVDVDFQAELQNQMTGQGITHPH